MGEKNHVEGVTISQIIKFGNQTFLARARKDVVGMPRLGLRGAEGLEPD